MSLPPRLNNQENPRICGQIFQNFQMVLPGAPFYFFPLHACPRGDKFFFKAGKLFYHRAAKIPTKTGLALKCSNAVPADCLLKRESQTRAQVDVAVSSKSKTPSPCLGTLGA